MSSPNRTLSKRLFVAFVVVLLLGLGAAQVFTFRQKAADGISADIQPSKQPNTSATASPSYPPAMGDANEKNAVTGSAPFTLPALPTAIVRLGSESVPDALVRLGREARNGNAEAAFDAFKIAVFCERRTALKATVDLMADAPNTHGDQTDKAAAAAAYERVVTVCGDLSPALLDERFTHIQIAAKAGLPNAADSYFLVGPRGIKPELLQQLRDDPSVVTWREQSLALLTRDAQKGDINAIGRLANLYSEDLIAPKNLQNALAYQLAMVELQGRQETKNKQWLQAMQQRRADEMSRTLPENERQAALKMAHELIKNIERRKSES